MLLVLASLCNITISRVSLALGCAHEHALHCSDVAPLRVLSRAGVSASSRVACVRASLARGCRPQLTCERVLAPHRASPGPRWRHEYPVSASRHCFLRAALIYYTKTGRAEDAETVMVADDAVLRILPGTSLAEHVLWSGRAAPFAPGGVSHTHGGREPMPGRSATVVVACGCNACALAA